MDEKLKGLDDSTLKQMLEAASSYEERSAIRKAIRDLKKQSGGGDAKTSATSRGTSTYNRFAGGRTVTERKATPKSFIPGGVSSSVSPIGGTRSPLRGPSPSTLTPPMVPSPEPCFQTKIDKEEKELQKKLKYEEEELEKEKMREEERRRREELERQKEEELRQQEEREEEARRQRELEREEEARRQRELEREEEARRQKEEEEELRRQEELRIQEREEELRRQREEEEERERQEELEREKRERAEALIRKQEEEEELKRQEELERERAEALRKQEEEEKRRTEEEMKRREEEREAEKQHQRNSATSTHSTGKDDTDLGTSPFGVQLKSRGATKLTGPTPTPKKSNEPSPEFKKLKLRKTDSAEKPKKTEGGAEFGASLKSHASDTHPRSSGVPFSSRDRSQSYQTTPSGKEGVGGAPRTLADFQKLTTRSRSKTTGSSAPSTGGKPTGPILHARLVDYVNAALELRPPLPRTGTALYDFCRKPSVLCRLINKSVRGTVDLRALTKTPPPSARRSEKEEALEENMTLVVESARAIGCSVTDATERNLIKGDEETIRTLLIHLIRARVVHLPGMEDEPSITFENFNLLMEKLGLSSQDEQDGEEEVATEDWGTEKGGIESGDKVEKRTKTTWRERDSERLREDLAKKEETSSASGSWREERSKVTPDIDINKPSLDAELSYEERAALRRAERERKRREREALANAK